MSVQVNKGGSVEFLISPNTGYTITLVIIDDVIVSSDNYTLADGTKVSLTGTMTDLYVTFSNIQGNHSLYASFAR